MSVCGVWLKVNVRLLLLINPVGISVKRISPSCGYCTIFGLANVMSIYMKVIRHYKYSIDTSKYSKGQNIIGEICQLPRYEETRRSRMGQSTQHKLIHLLLLQQELMPLLLPNQWAHLTLLMLLILSI